MLPYAPIRYSNFYSHQQSVSPPQQMTDLSSIPSKTSGYQETPSNKSDGTRTNTNATPSHPQALIKEGWDSTATHANPFVDDSEADWPQASDVVNDKHPDIGKHVLAHHAHILETQQDILVGTGLGSVRADTSRGEVKEGGSSSSSSSGTETHHSLNSIGEFHAANKIQFELFTNV